MLEIHGCFDITEYFKKCKAEQVLYYYGGWSDRCFQPWIASYLYSLIDHNFESHKDMTGFYQVEDIKSETLFKSIKNALNRMDIPLDFRRQYYDKSSNIVEARTGVVTRIKETLLWSRFTISCHWYRQSNKINRDTLDAASELTKLINILRKGKELSTDWGKKRHQETLVTEHYARLVGLSERYRYKAS